MIRIKWFSVDLWFSLVAVLLSREHLAMPGDWGCYWHFEGGSQGGLSLSILQCRGQLSTTGNYLVPNVRCQIWDQRLCGSGAWWQTMPPTWTCSSFAAHCMPGTVSRASHTSCLFWPAYRLKSWTSRQSVLLNVTEGWMAKSRFELKSV